MSLREKQSLFVFNIHLLIEWAYRNGFELTFGEVYRTAEQQAIYLASGISKTQNSRHLVRLAVDFNIFRNGLLINSPIDIKPLGDYWVTLNTDNVWGGDFNRNHSVLDETFKDPYHFETKP